MTEESDSLEPAIGRLKSHAIGQIVHVILSMARGTLYTVVIVFFARLTNFLTAKFETLLPFPGEDPYYETLKMGLSFIGSWGALIWFTAYTFKDIFIDFIYKMAKEDRK